MFPISRFPPRDPISPAPLLRLFLFQIDFSIIFGPLDMLKLSYFFTQSISDLREVI